MMQTENDLDKAQVNPGFKIRINTIFQEDLAAATSKLEEKEKIVQEVCAPGRPFWGSRSFRLSSLRSRSIQLR